MICMQWLIQMMLANQHGASMVCMQSQLQTILLTINPLDILNGTTGTSTNVPVESIILVNNIYLAQNIETS